LLAFDPVGGFLNDGMKFFGVADEEAGGVAFFASRGCFP